MNRAVQSSVLMVLSKMPTIKGRFVTSLAIVLLVFTLSCDGNRPAVDAEVVGAPSIGEHSWTTADGNSMPYVVGGKRDADVTVVFVHCWMGDRSFWNSQLHVLAAQYRTLTLDLPGHGEAGSQRTPWTVAGYGEDVAGLVNELELSDVVLVGHSMGGPVSLRAATLLPGKALGIVAVDTLQDADFEIDDEKAAGFIKAFDTDFVGACEAFVNAFFIEEGVEGINAHVRKAGCDAKRAKAGAALLRDYIAIDMPTWFREAGVPIRAINAATPNATNVEGNRKYADFDVVLMENVGHYLQMTRPDEFNELMIEAIADIVGH